MNDLQYLNTKHLLLLLLRPLLTCALVTCQAFKNPITTIKDLLKDHSDSSSRYASRHYQKFLKYFPVNRNCLNMCKVTVKQRALHKYFQRAES